MHYVGSNAVNRIALIDLNRRSNAEEGRVTVRRDRSVGPACHFRDGDAPKCLPMHHASQINATLVTAACART